VWPFCAVISPAAGAVGPNAAMVMALVPSVSRCDWRPPFR